MKKKEITHKKNEGVDNIGVGNKGNDNIGDYNTGSKNMGNYNNGHNNIGDWNTGDYNIGNGNKGNYNNGNYNKGNSNRGDGNRGDWNTGDYNIGDWNTGNWNVGNYNRGFLNNASDCFTPKEPVIYMFNKPSDLILSKFRESDAYDVLFKMYNVFHDADSRQKWWDNADDMIKSRILALPNFDADIFREITGIDVNKK